MHLTTILMLLSTVLRPMAQADEIPASVLTSLASAASITATGPGALSTLSAFLSLDSVVYNPPMAMQSLLASAIPPTVVDVITANPNAYVSFIEHIGRGTEFPAWLTTLPAPTQSAIESYYSAERIALAQLASMAAALGIGNPDPLNSYAAQTPTAAIPTATGMGGGSLGTAVPGTGVGASGTTAASTGSVAVNTSTIVHPSQGAPTTFASAGVRSKGAVGGRVGWRGARWPWLVLVLSLGVWLVSE